MALIVVEATYDPPLDLRRLHGTTDQLTLCFECREIRWLRLLVSLDRCRTICELEADDAESVRESYRMAGVPFERVWTAEVHED
jgi:Protein of unknown function (DUF4242)